MSAPREPAPLPEEAQRVVENARATDVSTPAGASERVWRRIALRRRPRRRWPVLAAGAACAALAAMLLVLHGRAPAEVAVVIRGNGMRRSLASSDTTTPLAELTLADLHAAGQLVIGRQTAVRLDRMGRGLVVTLTRGTLLVHVRPRAADEPFVIHAPGFSARVVGTVLRVTAGDAGAGLAVGHGRVELTPTGAAPVLLRAGERWPAALDNAPSPEELERLGPAELEGVTVASFTPPATTCAGTGREIVACRLAAARAAASASGEAAFYDVGQLAWRTLVDREVALAIWREARARYPAGALARETDESIIDALVALHRSDEARQEIEAYLEGHARSARAAEMRFVLGTVLRELDGDCRRAAAQLDRALAAATGPWAARARAARALCDPPPR